jgi:hypothetical protein
VRIEKDVNDVDVIVESPMSGESRQSMVVLVSSALGIGIDEMHGPDKAKADHGKPKVVGTPASRGFDPEFARQGHADA